MKLAYFILLSLIGSAYAQQETFTGIYKGHNPVIVNPFASDTIINIEVGRPKCIDSILVNQNRIIPPQPTAFILQLDSLGIKTRDTINITIYHKKGCSPRLIDSAPDIANQDINIKKLQLDSTGNLKWTVKNKDKLTQFGIYQYKWNKWTKIGSVKDTSVQDSAYSYKVFLSNGKNRLRIKYSPFLTPSNYRYSKEVSTISSQEKITFTQSATHINFSNYTHYELYDKFGNMIKKGFVKKVRIMGYPQGRYFLNYDNSSANITINY